MQKEKVNFVVGDCRIALTVASAPDPSSLELFMSQIVVNRPKMRPSGSKVESKRVPHRHHLSLLVDDTRVQDGTCVTAETTESRMAPHSET